jgi:hypothetical protein
MTFISNDPSLWLYINAQLFVSYWLGLLYELVMFPSNNGLHIAVAAGVMVVYDWGEQDIVPNLLPFL